MAVANALIPVMLLDRPQFPTVFAELKQVRQRALELGPKNPRVVLMDAGIIFNDPSRKPGRNAASHAFKKRCASSTPKRMRRQSIRSRHAGGMRPPTACSPTSTCGSSLLKKSTPARLRAPRCRCGQISGCPRAGAADRQGPMKNGGTLEIFVRHTRTVRPARPRRPPIRMQSEARARHLGICSEVRKEAAIR